MKVITQIVTLSLLLVAFIATEGFAQVVAGRPIQVANVQNRIKDSIKRSIKQHRLQCQQSLEACITEIAHVCNADEKQVSKLRIAAKGAIKKSLKAFAKDQVDRFSGRGFGAEEELDVEELLEEDEEKQNGLNNVVEVQALAVALIGRASTDSDITDDKFWKKAVEKTLTSDQQNELKKSRALRSKFRRAAIVQSQVAEIDAVIRLDEKQRNELVALLDKELGVELEKYGFGTQRRFMAPGNDQPIKRSLVEKILTKSQMKGWIQQIEPKLSSIKNAAAFNGLQRGAIRANLAAPAAIFAAPARPLAAPKTKKKK